MTPKEYDKVKYTWLRYVMMFMITYKWARAKWFLMLFKNHPSHICYKDGKEVKRFNVDFFITHMFNHF